MSRSGRAAAIAEGPQADAAAPDRLMATVALMVATAMQTGDATIVNVALPQLERDFGGGLELGAWVMTAYLCATAVVAPLSGTLRRRYGARRLFASAVGLFITTSLGCAIAPSWTAIIAFRIAQGAGGGLVYPMAQALLLDLYPRERHGRIMGIWGAAAMTGPILAPALGGLITDVASWRWAFAINLPLGLFALWGVWRALPRGEAATDLPVDAIGVGLLAIAIGALQLTLERSVGRSWLHSPELLGEAAAAILAAAAIAVRARRAGFSAFRPDVLKDAYFAAAAFFNFMTSALLFAALVFIPALAEGPLGYSASLAGGTIVPRAVLMMLAMLFVGRIIEKIDHRILLMTGSGLMASGLLLLSDVRPAHALMMILVGSSIQALGAGLLFTPLSTIAFWTLPPERRTDATGVYSLLRQVGCASGVALLSAVLQARTAAHMGVLGARLAAGADPAPIARAAELLAYSDTFRWMAVAALAVTPGILLFRGRHAKPAVNRTA